MKTRGKGERGSMKKVMNLKRLLFCAMLVLVMSLNVVNVQADALDYLGSTIDGSVLTNDLESSGTYQSVARSTYLHQGFVRITNIYGNRGKSRKGLLLSFKRLSFMY